LSYRRMPHYTCFAVPFSTERGWKSPQYGEKLACSPKRLEKASMAKGLLSKGTLQRAVDGGSPTMKSLVFSPKARHFLHYVIAKRVNRGYPLTDQQSENPKSLTLLRKP